MVSLSPRFYYLSISHPDSVSSRPWLVSCLALLHRGSAVTPPHQRHLAVHPHCRCTTSPAAPHHSIFCAAPSPNPASQGPKFGRILSLPIMETQEGILNSEPAEKIYQMYKDFLTRVTKLEELVAVGDRFLIGFQQGLEYLRQYPIDQKSELVGRIFETNETERLRSYFEARCINIDDGVHNISKSKNILSGLECLLEEVAAAMHNVNDSLSPIGCEDSDYGLIEQPSCNKKEEVASSQLQRPEVTDFVALMGIIYSMVKQDYVMQEKIVSTLNLKSSSGELESYCLMWSLRPFVNDEIMHQAWKLIP